MGSWVTCPAHYLRHSPFLHWLSVGSVRVRLDFRGSLEFGYSPREETAVPSGRSAGSGSRTGAGSVCLQRNSGWLALQEVAKKKESIFSFPSRDLQP